MLAWVGADALAWSLEGSESPSATLHSEDKAPASEIGYTREEIRPRRLLGPRLQSELEVDGRFLARWASRRLAGGSSPRGAPLAHCPALSAIRGSSADSILEPLKVMDSKDAIWWD